MDTMNINTVEKIIAALVENGGITLENGKAVNHKEGYQVGAFGIEVNSVSAAAEAVRRFKGNCGVWLSKGVYYIDRSFHFHDRKAALAFGKMQHQQSIFDWAAQDLIWCDQN